MLHGTGFYKAEYPWFENPDYEECYSGH